MKMRRVEEALQKVQSEHQGGGGGGVGGVTTFIKQT